MTEWTCKDCGIRRSSPEYGNCMCGESLATPSEDDLEGAEPPDYDASVITPVRLTLTEAIILAVVLFGPLLLAATLMVMFG